jgi:large subunit ribosomal protein L22
MPTVKAKLSYLRIAPRKVRLVADMVRRKKVGEAQTILAFTTKRGARPVLKLLNSAEANAKNNFHLDSENLYISRIVVDEGPKLKRFMPRARGSASPIQKKTSHITILLDEIVPGKKVERVEKEVKNEKFEDKIERKEAKPRFKPERKVAVNAQKKGIKRIFNRKSI